MLLCPPLNYEISEREGPMRREYWSTVAGAITFNIPITILNFTVVPPPFRVLVIDVSEVLRTTLLS
eukprot:COSAG01_NODE_73616_length_240_cov_89.276596_1_plen_65_part_01